eukprot:3638171-Pleurochrysis_carterae.AAC.1
MASARNRRRLSARHLHHCSAVVCMMEGGGEACDSYALSTSCAHAAHRLSTILYAVDEEAAPDSEACWFCRILARYSRTILQKFGEIR